MNSRTFEKEYFGAPYKVPSGGLGEQLAYFDNTMFESLQQLDAGMFSGDCFESLYPVVFIMAYSDRWRRDGLKRFRAMLQNDLHNPPYAPANWSDVGVAPGKVYQFCYKCGTGISLETEKQVKDKLTRDFNMIKEAFKRGWTVQRFNVRIKVASNKFKFTAKDCIICPECSRGGH